MREPRLTGISMLAAGALALAACGEEPASTEGSGEAAPVAAEKASSGPVIAKYFQAKSGIVEYRLTGARTGTETLYWDDWGQRQARMTKASITMMGVTQTTDDWVITLPDVVYTIDMKTKTAMRAENPAAALAEGLSAEDLEEFGRYVSEATGMKRVGTDTVAGLTCELWRAEELQSETCSYRGVPLRSSANMMGLSTAMTATRVELNARVDESRFKVPAGVTVSEAALLPPGLLDAMKGGMALPGAGE